jgi:hypothetical protein
VTVVEMKRFDSPMASERLWLATGVKRPGLEPLEQQAASKHNHQQPRRTPSLRVVEGTPTVDPLSE